MEDMIVCRCEGVLLSDILRSIAEGADTIPGIKRRIRVGMGHCQGRVCQPVVADILTEETGKRPVLQRAQAPVRPTRLGDIR
jgi:NAD(P)H-nitrite reductase large subunit